MKFRVAAVVVLLVLFAPVAWAGGDHFDHWSFWWYVVDFLVFVGAIGYFVRKPLRNYLEKRHDTVRETIEASAQMLGAAEHQHEDVSRKISRADEEVSALKDKMKSEGEADRGRIIEKAHKDAERMQQEAEFLVSQERKRVRSELELELIERSIQIVREEVPKKIGPREHARFVQEYLNSLASVKLDGQSP